MSGARPAPSGPVDLVGLAADERYAIEVRATERIEELQARLRREEAESRHTLEQERTEAAYRRRISWLVFAVVVAAGGVSVGIILFDQNAPAETQTWARTVASAVIAGLVGYFGGMGGKATR